MSNEEQFSVDAARAAAGRGELREWVARFLASPGSDNAPLAAGLTERYEHWIGPVELPRRRIERLAGPPDEPVLCAVDDDFWDERVEDMADRIDEDDWEPAPVIVTLQGGHLVLEDGNHRLEGLRRAGHDKAAAVVGFETAADLAAFDPSADCQ